MSTCYHQNYAVSHMTLEHDDSHASLFCHGCKQHLAEFESGRIPGFMRADHVLEVADLIRTHECPTDSLPPSG